MVTERRVIKESNDCYQLLTPAMICCIETGLKLLIFYQRRLLTDIGALSVLPKLQIFMFKNLSV
jgi:hypothetical protein